MVSFVLPTAVVTLSWTHLFRAVLCSLLTADRTFTRWSLLTLFLRQRLWLQSSNARFYSVIRTRFHRNWRHFRSFFRSLNSLANLYEFPDHEEIIFFIPHCRSNNKLSYFWPELGLNYLCNCASLWTSIAANHAIRRLYLARLCLSPLPLTIYDCAIKPVFSQRYSHFWERERERDREAREYYAWVD